MAFEWEKYFKRYVADDAKTPYLVPVDRLTRTQACYEVFFYVLLLSVLFVIVGVASVSSTKLPHGSALGVPLFAFSIAWAAIVFGFSKHAYAAAYCATAPVAALLYILLYGFHPNLGTADKVLIFAFLAGWLRYNWRVLMIAKAFPDMTDPPVPND